MSERPIIVDIFEYDNEPLAFYCRKHDFTTTLSKDAILHISREHTIVIKRGVDMRKVSKNDVCFNCSELVEMCKCKSEVNLND